MPMPASPTQRLRAWHSCSKLIRIRSYAPGPAWLDAYQAGGNIADACAAATAFAENPESYEALSDYGYANPTFTATDLCPVLAIQPAATPEPAATVETPAATATEPITPIRR